MNDAQRDINAVIEATGRGEEWFNTEIIHQALANIPGLSAKTAVTLGDYAEVSSELGEYGENIIECWREWGGRIWWVQLLPEIEEGVQILPVEAPGERAGITEEALSAPGKPTLAQLGL